MAKRKTKTMGEEDTEVMETMDMDTTEEVAEPEIPSDSSMADDTVAPYKIGDVVVDMNTNDSSEYNDEERVDVSMYEEMPTEKPKFTDATEAIESEAGEEGDDWLKHMDYDPDAWPEDA